MSYTLNNNLKVFLKNKTGTELKPWLEKHKDDLKNHRIFYILKANLEQGDVFKLGISERGDTSAYGRLNDYYHIMGKTSNDNKCKGVKLYLVVGNLFDPSVASNKVREVETKVIAELKKKGATERGRERFRISINDLFDVINDLQILKKDEETGNLKRSERILQKNQASKDTIKAIIGHETNRRGELKFDVSFYDYISYDTNQKAEQGKKQPNKKLTYKELVQLRDGKRLADAYIKKHKLQ
jgi:hypothetical protein